MLPIQTRVWFATTMKIESALFLILLSQNIGVQRFGLSVPSLASTMDMVEVRVLSS